MECLTVSGLPSDAGRKEARCGSRKFCIAAIAVLTFFIFVSYGFVEEGQARPGQGWRQDSLHERWIVVSALAQPTPALQLLASLPLWKVLVVADESTAANWSLPNCTLLSLEMQSAMRARSQALLQPWSQARKSLGYLYAVSRGARLIYDTEGDSRPLDGLQGFTMEPHFTGLAFVGDTIFNPYRHFGQSTLWPRGYPLSLVGAVPPNKYLLAKWDAPSIQQGLINGYPDIDITFRMTRKLKTKAFSVTFDPKAPNVALPVGVFAPINSRSTLFHEDALWGLVLPPSLPPAVTDVWRGYWAQRLLWELGGTVGFTKANAIRGFDTHVTLEATEEEKLRGETARLVAFLTNWTCSPKLKFFDCVVALSRDMAVAGFWQDSDVIFIEAWLSDLVSLGYRSPERMVRAHETQAELVKLFHGPPLSGEVGYNPDTNKTRVIFHPVEMPPPFLDQNLHAVRSEAEHLRLLREQQRLCPNVTFHVREEPDRQRLVQPDILLVSQFNWPYYEAVPFLETNNRHFYPNRLYCGENYTRFLNSPAASYPVTYIEAAVREGYYGYECTMHAISMGYHDIEAYFYLSEDVLVQPWLWNPSWHKRSWTTTILLEFVANRTWSWPYSLWGMDTVRKAVADMAVTAAKEPKFRALWERVGRGHESYLKGFNHSAHVFAGLGDVYVIAAKDAWAFLALGQHFRRRYTFLEIAVPFILTGLYPKAELLTLPGSDSYEARGDVRFHLNSTLYWVHPVKWRNTLSWEPTRHFLCQHFYNIVREMV